MSCMKKSVCTEPSVEIADPKDEISSRCKVKVMAQNSYTVEPLKLVPRVSLLFVLWSAPSAHRDRKKRDPGNEVWNPALYDHSVYATTSL